MVIKSVRPTQLRVICTNELHINHDKVRRTKRPIRVIKQLTRKTLPEPLKRCSPHSHRILLHHADQTRSHDDSNHQICCR